MYLFTTKNILILLTPGNGNLLSLFVHVFCGFTMKFLKFIYKMKWYQNETSKMNQFIVFFMQHDNIQFSIWLALFLFLFFLFGTHKRGDASLEVWFVCCDPVWVTNYDWTLFFISFLFIIIYRFSFTNKNNVTVRVINYGATITDILLPDKNGTVEDISLGFDSVQGSWNVGCSFLYYQNLRFIKFYNFLYYISMIYYIKNGTFKKMFWNGYC